MSAASKVRLRKATPSDALDVLAWRNDPLTRAMSRSAEEIHPGEHLAWFESALGNPALILLIGEADGGKVGMVRFDVGVETEVSINVNPACRGRGYGYRLLSQALAQVSGPVVADIRPDNLASQRIFERAGFRFLALRDGLRRYRYDPG
ncbi:MAG: GNAT family N-acetyltransferase [Phenylobacterium sp.]